MRVGRLGGRNSSLAAPLRRTRAGVGAVACSGHGAQCAVGIVRARGQRRAEHRVAERSTRLPTCAQTLVARCCTCGAARLVLRRGGRYYVGMTRDA